MKRSHLSFTKLDSVVLTEKYASNAMALERKYLLQTLDSDKLLYWFYRNANLEPRASSSYGGKWEGALIGGHTLGHYLTALSQSYRNANTPKKGAGSKQDFLERINYIVAELKRCQDEAVPAGAKAGFLWGAQMLNKNPESQFDLVEQKGASVNIFTEAWVPWYTLHKILQGLIDVATYTESDTAKETAKKLGDWVYNRAMKWTDTVRERVLSVEYGGMNDALYNLYALTGEEKYAVAAHRFDEEKLLDRILSGRKNCLSGLHANTTIPKVIGWLNRYTLCHGKTIAGLHIDASDYLEAAKSFWNCVIAHHTYVTGGNSRDEHFVQDDKLDSTRGNDNCETCNAYNMLKLSRTLFVIEQDKKYLDYYERTYYNAIWSSQNPETGMTTYFQPMAAGYFKVYSTPTENFWCCTGSGMESFTKLNDSIYFRSENAVYVSLYVSSRYHNESVSLIMAADLANSDTVKIHADGGSTLLYLRKPEWSQTFLVTLNGEKAEAETNGFVRIAVQAGDEVVIKLQKLLHAEALPDNHNTLAFLYGPFALSASLGRENLEIAEHGVGVHVPVAVPLKVSYPLPAPTREEFIQNLSSYFVKDDDTFTLTCGDTVLRYGYHFLQYQERYGLYLNFTQSDETVASAEQWTRYGDYYRPGYGQGESGLVDNGSTALSSTPVYNSTRLANANGSFTYSKVQVFKGKKNRLVVFLAKEDNGKTILITSRKTTIDSRTLEYAGSEEMYRVEIQIPDAIIQQSDGAIPITFSGIDKRESARLCYSIFVEVYNLHAGDCND